MPTPANALNLTTAGIMQFDGTGTFTGRPLTGTANNIAVTNGTGGAGNPTAAFTNPIYLTSISFDSGTNSLASYAAGSWTPTLPGFTFTFTTQTGFYVKVGYMVFATFSISGTNTGGAAAFTVGGLPFTVKNAGTNIGACPLRTDGVANRSNDLWNTLRPRINRTDIFLQECGITNSVATGVAVMNLAAGATVAANGTCIYVTDTA